MAHADDDPVIFHYSSWSNISFTGRGNSGYTWGDWRKMGEHERNLAHYTFISDTLGVEVWEGDDE